MKRLFIILVIIVAVTGGAFAQRNMVSGGLGVGISYPCFIECEVFASYEFAIVPQLSVGVSVALQEYPFAVWGMVIQEIIGGEKTIKDIYSPVAVGQIHWYPWAERFHIDLGVGYSNYLLSMHTIISALGVGWRFDAGEPGGFFFNVGVRVEIFTPVGDSIIKTDDGKNFSPINVPVIWLGLGCRF